MMTIDIPDDLSPQERKDLLIKIPTEYALMKFKNQLKAAKFLGVSQRCITDRLKKYPELRKYMYLSRPIQVRRYFMADLWKP